MSAIEEKQLISRILAGEKELFETLVEKYHDLAYVRAFALLLNREDAEETVQESFITAYMSLRTLRDRGKFGYWIGGIVRRKSIYFLRKKVKNRENLECLKEDFATQLVEKQKKDSSLETQIDDERSQILVKAVLSLPEKYREVVYMKYYRNLSYRDIGRFLGLTKSGVDTRLQRARARLKTLLEARGISYEL